MLSPSTVPDTNGWKQFQVVSKTQTALLLKYQCEYVYLRLNRSICLIGYVLYRLFALIKRKATFWGSRELSRITYCNSFGRELPLEMHRGTAHQVIQLNRAHIYSFWHSWEHPSPLQWQLSCQDDWSLALRWEQINLTEAHQYLIANRLFIYPSTHQPWNISEQQPVDIELWEGPLQCLGERVNYMWPAQLSGEKNKKTKKNSTRKIASAVPLPAQRASCFQLFSPAGQVLSGWTLTRGEANKDRQDRVAKLLQYFFLAAEAMNSFCLSCPGPFISYYSPGCWQGLWTLHCHSSSACDNYVLMVSASQASGSLPPSSVQLILIILWVKVCG